MCTTVCAAARHTLKNIFFNFHRNNIVAPQQLLLRQFMRNYLIHIFWFLCMCLPVANGQAQPGGKTPAQPVAARVVTDSLRIKDSLAALKALVPEPDSSLYQFYKKNTLVSTASPLVYNIGTPRKVVTNDTWFYLLAGLLLLLGIIRMLFPKYVTDLFRIFFQTTFRQKSIREQLLQNTLASLLLNGFFIISGGLFLYQLAVYNKWMDGGEMWLRIAFLAGLLGVVYLVKYIGLQVSGWLFNVKEMAQTYMFIVFLINKVMGVMLVPAIAILALGNPALHPIVVTLALFALGALYLYRYFIALPAFRSQVKISSFHFFVYLMAFEVVPVFLVYRLMLHQFA